MFFYVYYEEEKHVFYVFYFQFNVFIIYGLRYHHEILRGAKCDQKLGRVRKWLHFDALRRADSDVPSLTFYSSKL